MSVIDVSVVIVNYNVKDFLLQCLRSLERSINNLKTEIIVVDNNSSDRSIDFLAPLFPEVNFIRLDENIGFGRANNIGFQSAKGKYVLILNPDTIVAEQTLDIMYQYMEAHSETGISGCKVLNPDGTFQLACRRGFPTPWNAFSKLFGLQSLFPGYKLFSGYNQTYRSVDETYYIDSVIGAFMFVRKDVLDHVGGFDPDFFMYGEDIDLCYRVSQAGWKTAYVHTTSIIHYKGESTRRSSINEVRHFYQAMRIFAGKHYAHSSAFMLLMRLGIIIRSLLAYANKYKKPLLVMLTDILAINLTLMVATKIRFENYFGFPDYAYPIVFIVVTLVLLISMVGVGEYFESKPSIRRSFFGLLVSFFILSSLTYFFKQFAFSRGVLLMMIGFTIVIAALVRLMIRIYDKTTGKNAERRIALLGANRQSLDIIEKLESLETGNANVIGVITVQPDNTETNGSLNVIGNIEYLPRILEENRIREVIITDSKLASNELIRMISMNPAVKFHLAQEYEEILTARIVNEIGGFEPTIPGYNYTRFRYRSSKRIADLVLSGFLLTIGLPVVFLFVSGPKEFLKGLCKVFAGEYSFIGLYPLEGEKNVIGKIGLLGLAHAAKNARLSKNAIRKLNDYYLQHYSISLDIDIFIKYLMRKSSGI